MKRGDDYSATIQLYLDRELSDQDLEEFRAHLEECEACRTELEAEEKLSALLRRSRPLYSAPGALRARVMQAAKSFSSTTAHGPVRVRKRFATVLARPLLAARHAAHHWGALAATILLIATSLLFVPGFLRQASANSYIETAVAAHRSFLNGSLPLEVQSDSPSVVSAWFAGKVPFTFRLPSSAEESEHQQVYRLTGARLVQLQRWVCWADCLSDATAEDQPSSLFQPVCSGCGRRGGPFRRNHLSLPQTSELQCHYMEQSWPHVCFGLIVSGCRTAVLPGVPPKHVGWWPL
jgi:mycothiol system anti-sigma-R factor